MPEKKQSIIDVKSAYRCFLTEFPDLFNREEIREIRQHIERSVAMKPEVDWSSTHLQSTDHFTFSRGLTAALELCRSIAPDRNMVLAMILFPLLKYEAVEFDHLKEIYGADVAMLLSGLKSVDTLYTRHGTASTENYRNLLLTMARDIRVIIIMTIDRLILMRAINHYQDQELLRRAALDASYLYAPIAHRLGLYKIKGELEDMSLKYTDREMFTRIARKLNETKVARDKYIADFIKPVKQKLEAAGLNFEIKGRTKSIYSIWNKMVKQHTDVDGIYDLFAIRIILDVPVEKERAECWNVYSIVTDMYRPNPARLKDWLSVPKSNGYESLHITVFGPDDRWVEVQIRSRRMDEIAETGVAAHWKYKGVKSENNLDSWMNHVRDILEDSVQSPLEHMKGLNMDIYSKEVFVFTPKGDLFKLPMGATVLDFAFHIHSRVGCSCVGARVNSRSCKINHVLHSGDTVEIITAANQQPKADWLNIVTTSRARNKIRQALNEISNRAIEIAKETLSRRFKNRKIEPDEGLMMKLIKRLGYKTVTDFYRDIADDKLQVNEVIAEYEKLLAPEESTATVSAEEFSLQLPSENNESPASDVLVIGDGSVKGVNYKLARCCNPIYGDKVFGFISSEGVIKIHREDCTNAAHIKKRYPYRIITTKWSGKVGSQFVTTLTVLGTDDIGIVTNISSLITKQNGASLRAISIDSDHGLFHGYITIGVEDKKVLDALIKKISTVKGVKNVQRNN